MRIRLVQPRLLAFLAQSRLSQNHWALKLGLSRGHWSEIVNGKHPYPSPKTRERMIEVLGLPFEELFAIETEAPSADGDFRRAIADRYLIDTELGQGGMGAVYLARDVRHGRVVALKVIAPEAVSGVGITQFLREIATVAQLQHPHILPLFDSGEVAGHPFYVMPYIRGGSLRARLQAAIRLPVDEAVALTTGIAAALQHAHEARILHCDVKPENILLDGTHAYVMDFGIARKLHTEFLPWAQHKELDLSAGTPAYVSPEQASGEKVLDSRTDVYSLACVLYEMLTGRPPFEGTTTLAVVARRFVAPPTPLREFAPEIPPLLERAVERGMDVEPRRRPATPAEFSTAVGVAAKAVSGALGRLSVAVTRATTRLRGARRGLTIPFGSVLMETLWQDLRHAWRGLVHAPAFAAVVIMTLALGIGANTAIFSVVRGVLLKPLPHRDGDRLVYLRQSSDRGANMNFSVPEVRDFRTRARSLAQIAEYSPSGVVLRTDREAMRLQAGLVTGNYFEVMGLAPILGRVTRPSDDGPGVPAVVVLTHELWKRRFGSDSSIVGRILRADGMSAEVIGVLQPAPFFPQRMDVLMNMVISPHHIGAAMQEDRIHRMTEVVARMAPGATFDQVQAEVAGVYTSLGNEYPAAYDRAYHYRAEVMPFKKALGQDLQLTLWLMMGSAAFVMIIAVANVANLTLMRRVRRDQELVVRAALGSGAARLRRLLLAENLMLSVAGALVGTLVAVGGLPLLVSLANRYSARAGEIRLDATVLAFTLVLSVGTALILSFVTAVPSENDLSSVASGGRRSGGTLRKHRLQRALVVVQVAVSVVLLAGAGLLTRTMLHLADVHTGMETEEVLTMEIGGLAGGVDTRLDTAAVTRARALFVAIRDEIAALPGVEAVAIGSIPLRTGFRSLDLKAEGRPLAVGEAAPTVDARFASPSYFLSLGIPLRKGRFFQATDQGGDVAIVNQALAERLFPGEDPIGRRIAETNRITQYATEPDNWRTIVGVVGNTPDEGLDATPRPSMFYPQIDGRISSGGVIIRAGSGVATLTEPVIRIVRRLAPMGTIDKVMTVSQLKDQSVAPRRLNAVLISLFGILAVIIAAVGIAGVLAFAVSLRTKEIGIRMSLGADAGSVQRMILKEGGTLVVVGLLLGTALAFVASNVIRGLLFGVAPHDPATFTGVAVLMAAIGMAACWIPAARAARIDPAIAMRAEQ